MARNGKPAIGIGSELEVTRLGIVPEWWPLESTLARNWVRWTRLRPYYLIIDTLDVHNSNGYDFTKIEKYYGNPLMQDLLIK